jgi:DNA-binding CsgD family transcriptional regulator/PAS domain-containing protein
MIERAYAAALDPAHWRDFTRSIGEHFRGGSTMLWHANEIAASHRYEAKILRALEDRYAAINPWMPKKMLMSSGTLHRTEELYPEDELVKTEFYADLMAPNDLFKGFGITLFNDRRFSFLSIIRSKKAGAPAAAELHLLAQVTPHLQRALQVHERLQHLPPLGATALAALDALKRGVVFVGPNRNMIYANRAAERILAGRDGLFLDGKGACRACRAAEQASLDRLLDGAIGGRWRGEGGAASSGGVMLVRRPSGARAFGLVVAPMPSPPSALAGAHVAAVILISDPEADSGALREILRRLYQLSDREAELAVRIAEGERLEGAAKSLSVTYQTARSYLKSIFMKLGVDRQAELASLVQKLAALR